MIKVRNFDISLLAGVLALVVFFHIASVGNRVRAEEHDSLYKQGGGSAYGIFPDQRLTPLEETCRSALMMVGQAEYSYSSHRQSRQYAYLQELVKDGYLTANTTGRSLAGEYSISFYLPVGRDGFTLIAEPMNYELRPLMLNESWEITSLTTSIDGDPSDDWGSVREKETDYYWENGFFKPFGMFELGQIREDLQVRVNHEQSGYLIHRMITDNLKGRYPDNSMFYLYGYRSYIIGDTREFEY
ncbi:MAG TPA: hypothetical protein VGB30_09625 [bacterium]|jgi:hypothetical protein